MLTDLLATFLVQLLMAGVGHEKAHQMVSDEAKRRAEAQADAVARARIQSESRK